jgi:hypothetical protein
MVHGLTLRTYTDHRETGEGDRQGSCYTLTVSTKQVAGLRWVLAVVH